MKKPRSLVIILLALACLLAMACQTAGTPRKSPSSAETQATANTPTHAKGTPTQSQATVERQVLLPRQPASRSGTAASAARVKRATSAKHKGVADGTLANVKRLFSVITGRKIDNKKVINGAIAAGIVVLAIGAFAALSAIRHRRLTTSSSQARH